MRPAIQESLSRSTTDIVATRASGGSAFSLPCRDVTPLTSASVLALTKDGEHKCIGDVEFAISLVRPFDPPIAIATRLDHS